VGFIAVMGKIMQIITTTSIVNTVTIQQQKCKHVKCMQAGKQIKPAHAYEKKLIFYGRVYRFLKEKKFY